MSVYGDFPDLGNIEISLHCRGSAWDFCRLTWIRLTWLTRPVAMLASTSNTRVSSVVPLHDVWLEGITVRMAEQPPLLLLESYLRDN